MQQKLQDLKVQRDKQLRLNKYISYLASDVNKNKALHATRVGSKKKVLDILNN